MRDKKPPVLATIGRFFLHTTTRHAGRKKVEPMQEIFDWCMDHWSFVAFCLSLLVEFTPMIKFNPISMAFNWIGQTINKGVLERIEGLETRADQQRKSIDENEMDRIRWEVLDFANACRNHVKHTKDEFQHIIALNNKYHDLLKKYEKKNGVFDAEYAYILDLYEVCQKNNSFL